MEATSRPDFRRYRRRVVIPPVLDLVNHVLTVSSGAPALKRVRNPLPAPQQMDIVTRARSLLVISMEFDPHGRIDRRWYHPLDELLARNTRHLRVPPLAGPRIYLPTQSTRGLGRTLPGGWFDRRA